MLQTLGSISIKTMLSARRAPHCKPLVSFSLTHVRDPQSILLSPFFPSSVTQCRLPYLTSMCTDTLPACRYTTQLVVRLDGNRRVQASFGKTLYYALLLGVPVVDVSWLDDSLARGQLLPVDAYLAKVGAGWGRWAGRQQFNTLCRCFSSRRLYLEGVCMGVPLTRVQCRCGLLRRLLALQHGAVLAITGCCWCHHAWGVLLHLNLCWQPECTKWGRSHCKGLPPWSHTSFSLYHG